MKNFHIFFILDEMTVSASAADTRRWSSVVLGKIKNLWSYSSSSLMAGLNAISAGNYFVL